MPRSCEAHRTAKAEGHVGQALACAERREYAQAVRHCCAAIRLVPTPASPGALAAYIGAVWQRAVALGRLG
eukprot:SAG22_NODE_19852_length_271_cov_0.593023_1_plen_70_part_10